MRSQKCAWRTCLRDTRHTHRQKGMRLYVTNTLDDPFIEETQIASTYEPIARSQRQANKIKADTPVTVVGGRAVPTMSTPREGKLGGSVVDTEAIHRSISSGSQAKAPEYVLKTFYVYFYAWAMWKVFEAHAAERHGVVTFISTSGYLTGAGFAGMRRYIRRTCSEGWVVNVSPEGMRPDVGTRLFQGVQAASRDRYIHSPRRYRHLRAGRYSLHGDCRKAASEV